MIEIDGSYGEGGGQILRTSLSLSCVLRKPFRIDKIRISRPKPGLRPQHLASVKAAAQISGAVVHGASIGSETLQFWPHDLKGGKYFFDIGGPQVSAGCTSLVLQTVFLPLSLAQEPSIVILKGGTHVAWSPTFHYLAEVFIPTVTEMGIRAEARIDSWGWYPMGGGMVTFRIEPLDNLAPLRKVDKIVLDSVETISASSNLPEHIALRQQRRLLARLSAAEIKARGQVIAAAPSIGQGTLVFLEAIGKKSRAGFSSLGEKGKRAEEVADEVADLFLSFLATGAAIDEHLADQVVPYMALSGGESRISTSRITSHLVTNVSITERFTDRKFQIEGTLGKPGIVTCFAQERDNSLQ